VLAKGRSFEVRQHRNSPCSRMLASLRRRWFGRCGIPEWECCEQDYAVLSVPMPRNGGRRPAGAAESATIRMSGPGCKADMLHDRIWLAGIDPMQPVSFLQSGRLTIELSGRARHRLPRAEPANHRLATRTRPTMIHGPHQRVVRRHDLFLGVRRLFPSRIRCSTNSMRVAVFNSRATYE
jgi:hypothetical protein